MEGNHYAKTSRRAHSFSQTSTEQGAGTAIYPRGPKAPEQELDRPGLRCKNGAAPLTPGMDGDDTNAGGATVKPYMSTWRTLTSVKPKRSVPQTAPRGRANARAAATSGRMLPADDLCARASEAPAAPSAEAAGAGGAGLGRKERMSVCLLAALS